MTYNVFGGTLNLAQLSLQLSYLHSEADPDGCIVLPDIEKVEFCTLAAFNGSYVALSQHLLIYSFYIYIELCKLLLTCCPFYKFHFYYG